MRAEENLQLSITSPGLLDTLTWQPATRCPPGRGEVEIEVAAASLSFQDVLMALGMVPASGPVRFGPECVGTVVALGEDVNELRLGEPVFAVGAGCLSSYLTTAATRVGRIPAVLGWVQAATLPGAFLTATYALDFVARLRRTDKILIHAATGGVGLAAVQVAARVGAEIFATAGTHEKRAYLRSLGITYVMDSRSLSFADEVLAMTHGRGVDVVLNSLKEPFISAGLSVLAEHGRFVELGRQGMYARSTLDLGLFEKGLSFSFLDFNSNVPDFDAALRQVLLNIERGAYQPLPHQVFPAAEATSAFSLMARAGHIGRVVLAWPDRVAAPRRLPELSARSTSGAEQSAGKGRAIDVTRYLSPTEGIDVFDRILAGGHPQVAVSTLALQERSEQMRSNHGVWSELQPRAAAHPRPALATPYLGPRDERERVLAAIWQSLLGIERVGVNDGFFDLGGDSLLAVQVLARIQSAFNARLSTHVLMQTPTIAELARALAEQSSPATTRPTLPPGLVELKPGTSKTRLFLIHPLGGHVYIYRDLVSCLAAGQQVFGIEVQGLEEVDETAPTIEQMAARYVGLIRAVQSEGPYILGGASFGGVAAYEVAQQLLAQGQQVAFVAMLDSPSPGYMPSRITDEAEVLAYILNADANEPVAPEQLRELTFEEQVQYVLSRRGMRQFLPTIATAQLQQFLKGWRACLSALFGYVPQPCSVPLVFFRAREPYIHNSTTPHLGWVPLARSGMEVHEAPGNHVTMNYLPRVRAIAETLQGYLDAVERGAHTLRA